MNDPVLRFLAVNTAVSLVLALIGLGCSWARLRPQIVHLLWLAALAKLITPAVVPVPVWSPAPAPHASSPAMKLVSLPSRAAGAPPLGGGAAVESTALRTAEPPPEFRWRPWLLRLWGAGTLLWVALALWRMGRFHRLLREAEPITSSIPRVWVIDAAISPLLWAFLGRARIIVPKALFDALSEPERQAVVCHERVHFRRRDHWVRWLEFVVLAALWWHPLAWWISRRLRFAEEACCDAEVVAETGDPRGYASALLRTALFLSETTTLPRTATGIGTAATIQKRIRTIMPMTAPLPRRLSWATSAALVSVTAFAVLAVPVEKSTPPPSPALDLSAGGESEPATVAESGSNPPAVAPAGEPPQAIASADAPARTGNAAEASSVEHTYLTGYMKSHEAEHLQRSGDFRSARRLYAEALNIFQSVRSRAPQWQTNMVEYRIRRVRRELGLLVSTSDLAQKPMILSPVSPSTKDPTERTGMVTELLGQSLVVAADRIEGITPDNRTGRSRRVTFKNGEVALSAVSELAAPGSTFRAEGSVFAGWGIWRIRADSLEIKDSTLVFGGSPFLMVDVSQDPPTTILDGGRLVVNAKDNTLRIFDASLFLVGGQVLYKNDKGTMELMTSLDSSDLRMTRMRGATATKVNISGAELKSERTRLLQKWPSPAEWEAELGPLVQPPHAKPLRNPVDGPRQEPLPKEDTPPKKLPS